MKRLGAACIGFVFFYLGYVFSYSAVQIAGEIYQKSQLIGFSQALKQSAYGFAYLYYIVYPLLYMAVFAALGYWVAVLALCGSARLSARRYIIASSLVCPLLVLLPSVLMPSTVRRYWLLWEYWLRNTESTRLWFIMSEGLLAGIAVHYLYLGARLLFQTLAGKRRQA
jgi:hypothetical protein